jgi:hypothetical protein
VDVEKGSPKAVQKNIMELLEGAIKETAKGLKFSVWLSEPTTAPTSSFTPSSSTSSSPLSNPDFLSLAAVQGALQTSGSVMSADMAYEITYPNLRDNFSCWDQTAVSSEYDVFMSYRWGVEDGHICQGIYSGLGNYNVTSEARAIVIFKDSACLKPGMDFLQGFVSALLKSRVIVPLVTEYALERMRGHDALQPDYTLMEWILAIVLFDSDPDNHRVFPLLLGSVTIEETGCRSALDHKTFSTYPGDKNHYFETYHFYS